MNDILSFGGEERMVSWLHYYEIQKFKRKGFSKSQTVRKIGINRETIGIYWDISSKISMQDLKQPRQEKGDPHKDFVL